MELTALIMAGGEGKRFWPMSTRDKPKQFIMLTGEKSLIRQTVDRIKPLIPIENIYVVTLERYAEETLKHLPELPEPNLVLEPDGKNTAPCVALGTLRIQKDHGDCVTVVLPADHAISDDDVFRETLSFASATAMKELENGGYPLVTLGIIPRSPETGYGYIKSGDHEITSTEGLKALVVEKFTEKPERETAENFLSEGGYYWNSGIFIWKTASILRAFSEILPDWYAKFTLLSENLGLSSERKSVSEFYSGIHAGSIDREILERSENTAVVPADFKWSDVGSWKALYDFLDDGRGGNVVRGNAVVVDSSGCLVMGTGKRVALVGVQGLVVVETEDALLVLDRESSQDVRRVVEELNRK